jgi:hypothetical protein
LDVSHYCFPSAVDAPLEPACGCAKRWADRMASFGLPYDPGPEERRKHDPVCPHFVEWRDLGAWVYFVQSGPFGPIKIGKAKDVAQRLKSLQTAHFRPLALLGAIRGGEPMEAALHGMFAADRLHGEWFRATGQLAIVIHCTAKPAEPLWDFVDRVAESRSSA